MYSYVFCISRIKTLTKSFSLEQRLSNCVSEFGFDIQWLSFFVKCYFGVSTIVHKMDFFPPVDYHICILWILRTFPGLFCFRYHEYFVWHKNKTKWGFNLLTSKKYFEPILIHLSLRITIGSKMFEVFFDTHVFS